VYPLCAANISTKGSTPRAACDDLYPIQVHLKSENDIFFLSYETESTFNLDKKVPTFYQVKLLTPIRIVHLLTSSLPRFCPNQMRLDKNVTFSDRKSPLVF
jgi:hypothetical protein